MAEKHESQTDGASATLPAPTTYDEYKRNRNRGANRSNFQVKDAGESGRRGIHPWHFFRISFRSASRASALCNLLWPVVPAAFAVRCKWQVGNVIFLPSY